MTRKTTLLCAAAALALTACAEPAPSASTSAALMVPAAAPAAALAAAPTLRQPQAPPPDHPAFASARAVPQQSRVEQIVGVPAVPEPAADAPPLQLAEPRPVGAGSTLGSTTGSKLSGLKLDPTAPMPEGVGCQGGLRGLSSEFPWQGSEGGVWKGTGHDDPEPLEKVSDDDMLARAQSQSEDTSDREHALVSIGRRQLSGAIEIFDRSLDPGEPLAVREMALSGLIEHGGADALPLMWRALRSDPAAQIRGMAVWAVALYGPSEAHRAILAGLEDPTYDVQGMAVLATWALKDQPEQAMPVLEAAARSDKQRLYQEGLNVLARMPYSDAGNLLEQIARTSEGSKANSAVLYYRMWRRSFPDLCD